MKSYRGQCKDYLQYCKDLKKLCVKMYGIGFYLSTPHIRAVLIESANDLINDLVSAMGDKHE